MKNSKKKVFAYIHTHWDREWYREFEEFRIRLVEVFDDVIEKLEHNELETFYFDGQTSALEDYLEIKPENKQRVEKLIKTKKLFIGPYFCSTDSFLIDSESIIKNLQLGINYSKEFGCKDFIAYHADTFGHSSYISNIIKYFDIQNAVFWRGLGKLPSEFCFNGVNSIYLIEGYFHDYFTANLPIEKKAEFLKRTLDRIAKYSSKNILLPIGADHLATPDNIKSQIKELNKILKEYEIILSTPFEYMKKVQDNFKKSVKSELRDTQRNFILPGVLSSRIDLKQLNTKLQWELSRFTQPLQAVSLFLNNTKNFQNSVNYTYKELIKNHAHDSIYGCSIDAVHEENKLRYKKITQVSNSIINSVKRDLFDENDLSVINLSNFALNGALKILTTKKLEDKFNAQLISVSEGFPLTKVYRTNEIPITEDYTNIYEYLVDLKNIKPFSQKTIIDKDINKISNLKITAKTIENDFLKLSVNKNNIVLFDKIQNKTYKNFINIIDRADIGDSYNFGALSQDKPIYAQIVNTKIKTAGRIRCTLEIDFEIKISSSSDAKGRLKSLKKHIIKLFVTLENQNDFLEFDAVWENKSCDHILQIEFNLEKPITETISDDLCGYTKRKFDPDYDIYEQIPAQRGIELKHNTAPLQKCLLVQNVGLVTEGLQEYEICKNNLRLTILRATGTISNPHNPTRGTPAGPPLKTPDLQMIRQNKAKFAIAFKRKINELEPIIEKFFETAVVLNAKLEQKSYIKNNNKNILVNTIKTNNENSLVVRFLNKSNVTQKFDIKTELEYSKIYITDALEQVKNEFAPTIVEANSFITIKIN